MVEVEFELESARWWLGEIVFGSFVGVWLGFRASRCKFFSHRFYVSFACFPFYFSLWWTFASQAFFFPPQRRVFYTFFPYFSLYFVGLFPSPRYVSSEYLSFPLWRGILVSSLSGRFIVYTGHLSSSSSFFIQGRRPTSALFVERLPVHIAASRLSISHVP